MYGLTKKDKNDVLKKMEFHREYLQSHYIQVGGKKEPLIGFFKNTYINQDRYIAELQHRVWSLVEYAKGKSLVNVFLTLTLPTEYHPTRTLGNGKIVKNPKFANNHIVIYDIETKERSTSYEKMHFKFYKSTNRVRFSGKVTKVSLLPSDYTPKKGSKKLTDMFQDIRSDRSFRDIDSDNRIYFRVTEPHKSGTPHIHISLWIPEENVSKFVKAVHRFYPAPRADVATSYIPSEFKLFEKGYKQSGSWMPAYKLSEDSTGYIRLQIEDTIGYLMKYIYKSLDDLREDKGVTELTMWYIHHGLCRFYTSRTLMSLDVYRSLGGMFSLLALTSHYKDEEIVVYLDMETRKPRVIEWNGSVLWSKQDYELKEFDKYDGVGLGSASVIVDKHSNTAIPLEIDGENYYLVGNEYILSSSSPIKDVNKMKSLELWTYYNSLDYSDSSLNMQHYFHVRNTVVNEGLLDAPILSLNYDYNFAEDVS